MEMIKEENALRYDECKFCFERKRKNDSDGEKEGKSKKEKLDRGYVAAVVITILVAGEASFLEEDLSTLCLEGGNLRNGIFVSCNFSQSCLKNCNIRNANFEHSVFVKSHLQDVNTGLFPEMRGHSGDVWSVSWSQIGRAHV